MDKTVIQKLIQQYKRRSVAVSAVFMVAAFLCVLLMESPLKYVAGVALIAAGIGLSAKILNVSALLFDRCDAPLYYAVAQGLTKEISPERQALVAEYIGDYTAAISLLRRQTDSTNITLLKGVYLSDMARCAFLAGDKEQCAQLLAKYEALPLKHYDKLQQAYAAFYRAYLSGDYQMAKAQLIVIDKLTKRPHNATRCQLLYLHGITDYASGETEKAVAAFREIADRFPKMYFATAADSYLDSIKNNTPLVLHAQPAPEPLPTDTAEPARHGAKKPLIALAIILICLIGIPAAVTATASAPTPEEAIAKTAEAEGIRILNTIPIDDACFVCLCTDKDGTLGEAYLKRNGDKYLCGIANLDDTTLLALDADSPRAKMHATGKTCDIVFFWTPDSAHCPKGYDKVSVDSNGRTLWFCYQIQEARQHFSNIYMLLPENE